MGMIEPLRRDKRFHLNWLFTVGLIIAAYMVIDGFAFLLNPYSGRISTFACQTDSLEKTVCTVTIYGLRQVYRRSFTPDEFYRAVVIANNPGDSGDITYGLMIQTYDENINYIFHIHPPGGVEKKAGRINDMFVEGEPTPDTFMVHIGYDPSLYRRIILAILGLGLAWFAVRGEISWPRFDQSLLRLRRLCWPFVWYWVKWDLLVRIGFYLSIASLFGCSYFRYANYMADFLSACRGVFIREPQLSQFPWGYLLCLYPLVLILVLQAVVQRQLLASVNIKLSAWWVAVPVLSSFVLPVFTPQLTCDDCQLLKSLMSGLIGGYDAPISTGLVFYFSLVGLFQWIILRKKLPRASFWITLPLINSMLVILVYLLIDYNLPNPGGLVLLILVAMVLSEIIPAMTMSWLANRAIENVDAK